MTRRAIVVVAMAACVPPINKVPQHPVAPREHRVGIAAVAGATIMHSDVGGALDYFVSDQLAVGVSGRRYFDTPLSSSFALTFGYSLLGVPLLPDLHPVIGIGAVGDNGAARIASQIGIGNRWFVTDYLAIGVEMRDTIFVEPKTTAMPGRLTDDVTFDVSLTLFVPTYPLR